MAGNQIPDSRTWMVENVRAIECN